jgi:O-antigen/teichoic acid export membrane protein
VVTGAAWAAVLAAAVAGLYVGLWYVLPFVRRNRWRRLG